MSFNPISSNPLSSAGASVNALILTQMRPALVKYFKRRCGSTDLAEDLAQDVLVRALGHAHWTSPEHAKGYIFRSAVNRWHDHRRKMLTHGTAVEWDESAAARLSERCSLNEESGPEHVLILEQELNQVAQALAELSERARDVCLLVRLEGMKQSAVAEMLGISVSTVEKELVKALAHLARCSKQRDGVP